MFYSIRVFGYGGLPLLMKKLGVHFLISSVQNHILEVANIILNSEVYGILHDEFLH